MKLDDVRKLKRAVIEAEQRTHDIAQQVGEERQRAEEAEALLTLTPDLIAFVQEVADSQSKFAKTARALLGE